MAKFGLRTISDIGFYLLPVARIMANPFTRSTNWNESLKGFDFTERMLELGNQIFLLTNLIPDCPKSHDSTR